MTLEVICPRMLWRIDNISTSNRKKSSSFHYLDSDWQWEYVVHVDEVKDSCVMKSAIFLTRLSSACDSKLVKKFFSSVYIKTPEGRKIFEQMYTYDIKPRNRWIVFEVAKESIVGNKLNWNDCCIFSCSLEPVGTYEELASLEVESSCSTPLCLQSLSSDFERMLKDSPFADITLKCEDRKFPVHRFMLASRSEKFADLFRSAGGSKCNPAKPITVDDIRPDVLKVLIDYIYTGSVRLSVELAENVYKASYSYGVQSLMKRSALFIMENLNDFKPCDMLLLAEEYQDNYLKHAVASQIANDLSTLASEEWKDFTEKYKMLAIEVFRLFVQRSHLRS